MSEHQNVQQVRRSIPFVDDLKRKDFSIALSLSVTAKFAVAVSNLQSFARRQGAGERAGMQP